MSISHKNDQNDYARTQNMTDRQLSASDEAKSEWCSSRLQEWALLARNQIAKMRRPMRPHPKCFGAGCSAQLSLLESS
jgi:hypothetical protein